MTNIWLILGLTCILAEFLVPGLVLVFIGLGALTTYLFIYLGIVDSIVYQIIIFFISSIIYLIGLRTIILSFFPTNTASPNINEDEIELGETVIVDQDIIEHKGGRIRYQDTTWNAKSLKSEIIPKGNKVKITGRENITYIVEKL